jgi:hypothetical protein
MGVTDVLEEAGYGLPEEPAHEGQSEPHPRAGLDFGVVGGFAPAVAAPRTAPALVQIRNILGVPLYYERGQSPTPTAFSVAPSFIPVLEANVRLLQERAPASFGQLKRISSAGMYVNKPGAHGLGRACDWDRLVFEHVQISPLAHDHVSPSLAKRQRYWAFAAICRSNSCWVLHGFYNQDHADHIHVDDTTGVGFNNASSTVKLVQAVLNDIFGERPKLAVDGDYGTKTKNAVDRALVRIQLAGDIRRDVGLWRQFLRRSARLGFVESDV